MCVARRSPGCCAQHAASAVHPQYASLQPSVEKGVFHKTVCTAVCVQVRTETRVSGNYSAAVRVVSASYGGFGGDPAWKLRVLLVRDERLRITHNHKSDAGLTAVMLEGRCVVGKRSLSCSGGEKDQGSGVCQHIVPVHLWCDRRSIRIASAGLRAARARVRVLGDGPAAAGPAGGRGGAAALLPSTGHRAGAAAARPAAHAPRGERAACPVLFFFSRGAASKCQGQRRSQRTVDAIKVRFREAGADWWASSRDASVRTSPLRSNDMPSPRFQGKVTQSPSRRTMQIAGDRCCLWRTSGAGTGWRPGTCANAKTGAASTSTATGRCTGASRSPTTTRARSTRATSRSGASDLGLWSGFRERNPGMCAVPCCPWIWVLELLDGRFWPPDGRLSASHGWDPTDYVVSGVSTSRWRLALGASGTCTISAPKFCDDACCRASRTPSKLPPKPEMLTHRP